MRVASARSIALTVCEGCRLPLGFIVQEAAAESGDVVHGLCPSCAAERLVDALGLREEPADEDS